MMGDKATKPTNPQKSGYTFDNWYEEVACTNVYDFNKAVTKDITLYAKWNIANHTVTFDSQGGSAVASQTVHSGDKATKPTNPQKSGYTFDNWYEEVAYTNVYDFNKAVTKDITLYAKWNEVVNPTPQGGGSSGGSSSGSSSGGNSISSGTINANISVLQNEQDVQVANNMLAPENISPITKNENTNHLIDTTTATINWEIDPITKKWKLKIGKTKKINDLANGVTEGNANGGANSNSGGGAEAKEDDKTNAKFGFYNIAKTTEETDVKTGAKVPKTTISTYYFDHNSLMHIGWLTTADIKTYYFEPKKTSDEGKMITGWKDINTNWYYFNKDGELLKNTITPDGYKVDINGAWVK